MSIASVARSQFMPPQTSLRVPAPAVQYLRNFLQQAGNAGRMTQLQSPPKGFQDAVSVHLTPGMQDAWTYLEQVQGQLYEVHGGWGPGGVSNTWTKVEGGTSMLRDQLAQAQKQGRLVSMPKPPAGLENAKRLDLTPGIQDAGTAMYVLNDKIYVNQWTMEGKMTSRWSILTA